MGLLSKEKATAINAITTVTITSWIKDAQGNALDVQFQRQDPPPVVPFRAWRVEALPGGPPPRLPSRLPPPGSNKLTISIGELIGDGRCGVVYATGNLNLTDNHDSLVDMGSPEHPLLPELVIKVASPERDPDLKKEASNYQEMEVLQGVSIPRCYGLFVAEVNPNWTLPSTAPGDTPAKTPQSLSILVLEKLGEPLPLGAKIPEEGDLWDVFRDLARLGIEQTDIRYSNILFAPPSPPGLPGLRCPFHDCVHVYRIFDFDNARKTDITPKQHYYSTLGTLGPILEMMRQKIIIEPWDIVGNPGRHSVL